MNTLVAFAIAGIALYALTQVFRRQPAAVGNTGGGVLLITGRSHRFSHVKVLGGLVLGTLVWMTYIGVTSLYLATHPPFLSEWWMLVGLADIVGFGFCMMSCFPKAYRDYMDRKSKGAHTAFDYFVGLVMTLVFLPGVAIHLSVLASSPHFAL